MNTIAIGLPVKPVAVLDDGVPIVEDTETNAAAQIRIMAVKENYSAKPFIAVQVDYDLIPLDGTTMIQHLKDVIESAASYTPGDEIPAGDGVIEAPDIFGNGQSYAIIELDV